jgi:hypothetical protein
MSSKLILTGLLTILAAGTVAAGEGIAACQPAEVTPGLATANQRWPAVAAGKDSYLAVWQDGDMMAGVKKVAIVAARVGADGKPLDAGGIKVCDADGLRGYPTVAFDGTEWVVAWQDFRNGEDWDLYAARVALDGKVLDANGFLVQGGQGNQIYPTAASDGKGAAFIAWSDVRPGFEPELYRLYGALVRDGKAAPAFEIAKGDVASLLDPRAAWDGEAYAIVADEGVPGWDDGKPRAWRVPPDGKAQAWKLAPFLVTSFALGTDPAAKRACVFSSARNGHGAYHTGYVSIVAPAGQAGAAHAVAGFQETYNPRNELWGAVVFDGKSFVVAVEQSDMINEGRQASPSVWLQATRVGPADPAARDVPSIPMVAGTRPFESPEFKAACAKGQKGLRAVYEKDVQLRHPALASLGGGRSLLVYSRHGGVDKYRIQAVVLSE